MKSITATGPRDLITAPELLALGIEQIDITYGFCAVHPAEGASEFSPGEVRCAAEVKVNGVPWDLPVIADGLLAPPFRATDIYQFEDSTGAGPLAASALHPNSRAQLRGWIIGAAEVDSGNLSSTMTADQAAA